MKKLKYGIYKILKALDQPTESLQDTTSMTDPTSARLHDPSAPVVKTAALRKGGSSSASATANSLFFNLLPIELRLRILDASFGGRTLHIGYGAPQVVPYSQYQPKASLSGGEHCAWRPRRISKSAKSWVGCVCHRLSGDDDFGLRLVHDTCLDGDADCWAWEGEIPHKCWLGVMGWLLTCRQAYWEGLDILFNNNTFHLHPDHRTKWPADPCPAFRSIKSLELIAFTGQSGSTPTQAKDLVQMVPVMFPKLKHLYIAFGRHVYDQWTHGSKQTYLKFCEDMLPLIDELARRYTRGSLQLEVGAPTSVFYAYLCVGLKNGQRFQAPRWKPGPGRLGKLGGFCERKRIWRAITTTEDEEENGHYGYWLSETDSDMPDAWMITMSQYWE